MRVLSLLALAGCLSSPEGKPQTWPVEGARVVAAITTNLDADEDEEIVIAAGGPGAGWSALIPNFAKVSVTAPVTREVKLPPK